MECIGILLAEGGPLPPDNVVADIAAVSRSTVLAAKRTGTALGLLDGKLDQTGPAEMSDDRKDRDRRKFGDAAANWLFSRLFSGRGWMRGLDVEAGKDRG